MRLQIPKRPRRWLAASILLVAPAAGVVAYRSAGEPAAGGPGGSDPPVARAASCAVALVPHAGVEPLDRRIAAAQAAAGDDPMAFADLGWLYVAKARNSYDPGFFALAERSAECGLRLDPASLDALLLKGHALYSLHRFRQAGRIAERLVDAREDPFDHGLRGDVALAEGRTRDAIEAYQRMVDLRPNLQSYSRAAHLRWVRGDVDGAAELMQMAASAGSRRDPDAVAWAYAELAGHELQLGRHARAEAAIDNALAYRPDHAPALRAKGRLALARGETGEAIAALSLAAERNPSPEYEWILADALRVGGREPEARAVEKTIVDRGALEDPRTTALFLATRAIAGAVSGSPGDADTALALAEEEIDKRRDVATRDTLAWASLAAGNVERARAIIAGALAEGTRDARLYLHAGVIAARAGAAEEAVQRLADAAEIADMLLPSERALLERERVGETFRRTTDVSPTERNR